eukprot:GDKJ01020570.1.p1 GENE.GDKJ01020570.1~~GDKJ01020570.1.p1  ORF type:complete len:956 (+),score=187.47 GDKJ01020570.1:126-2870(+)
MNNIYDCSSLIHLTESLHQLKSFCGKENDDNLSIVFHEIEDEIMKISLQLQKTHRSTNNMISPPKTDRAVDACDFSPAAKSSSLEKSGLTTLTQNRSIFIEDLLSRQPDDMVIRPAIYRPGKYVRQGLMSPSNTHPPLSSSPPGRVFEPDYPLASDWAARVTKPRREDCHTRLLTDFQGDLNLVLASGCRAPIYPTGENARIVAQEAFITTPRLKDPQQLIPFGAVIKPSGIPIVLNSSVRQSTLTPALRTRAHDFHSQTPLSNPGRLAFGDTPHSEAKKPVGRAAPHDPSNPLQAVAHVLHAAGVTTSDPDPMPSTLPPGVAAQTFGTVHLLETEYAARYKPFLFNAPENQQSEREENINSSPQRGNKNDLLVNDPIHLHSHSNSRQRVPHQDRFDYYKPNEKQAWNGEGISLANARRVAAASKGLIGSGAVSQQFEHNQMKSTHVLYGDDDSRNASNTMHVLRQAGSDARIAVTPMSSPHRSSESNFSKTHRQNAENNIPSRLSAHHHMQEEEGGVARTNPAVTSNLSVQNAYYYPQNANTTTMMIGSRHPSAFDAQNSNLMLNNHIRMNTARSLASNVSSSRAIHTLTPPKHYSSRQVLNPNQQLSQNFAQPYHTISNSGFTENIASLNTPKHGETFSNVFTPQNNYKNNNFANANNHQQSLEPSALLSSPHQNQISSNVSNTSVKVSQAVLEAFRRAGGSTKGVPVLSIGTTSPKRHNVSSQSDASRNVSPLSADTKGVGANYQRLRPNVFTNASESSGQFPRRNLNPPQTPNHGESSKSELPNSRARSLTPPHFSSAPQLMTASRRDREIFALTPPSGLLTSPLSKNRASLTATNDRRRSFDGLGPKSAHTTSQLFGNDHSVVTSAKNRRTSLGGVDAVLEKSRLAFGDLLDDEPEELRNALFGDSKVR